MPPDGQENTSMNRKGSTNKEKECRHQGGGGGREDRAGRGADNFIQWETDNHSHI